MQLLTGCGKDDLGYMCFAFRIGLAYMYMYLQAANRIACDLNSTSTFIGHRNCNTRPNIACVMELKDSGCG